MPNFQPSDILFDSASGKAFINITPTTSNDITNSLLWTPLTAAGALQELNGASYNAVQGDFGKLFTNGSTTPATVILPGRFGTSGVDCSWWAAFISNPPNFVQGKANAVGSAQTLPTTFDAPSVAGNTIIVAVGLIQSLSANADSITCGDSDGNIYTQRFTYDGGGSGNSTMAVFDTIATTGNTLTVTIDEVGGHNKNIHVAIHEYRQLGSFISVTSAWGNSGQTQTITAATVAANSFNFLFTNWQGFPFNPSPIAWQPVPGYTAREIDTDNVSAIGTGAIATWDAPNPTASSSYSVGVTDNDTGGSAAWYGLALLNYGTIGTSGGGIIIQPPPGPMVPNLAGHLDGGVSPQTVSNAIVCAGGSILDIPTYGIPVAEFFRTATQGNPTSPSGNRVAPGTLFGFGGRQSVVYSQ